MISGLDFINARSQQSARLGRWMMFVDGESVAMRGREFLRQSGIEQISGGEGMLFSGGLQGRPDAITRRSGRLVEAEQQSLAGPSSSPARASQRAALKGSCCEQIVDPHELDRGDQLAAADRAHVLEIDRALGDERRSARPRPGSARPR